MSHANGEEVENQRKRNAIHQSNLQGPQSNGSETAEALRYISEIDDLPVDADDPVMGQLVSKLTSTANLTAEQVRSNEWVREYLLILWMARQPPEYGVHGGWRAWAHDDADAALDPLAAEERLQAETTLSMTKLGLTRSEEMEGVKESMRERKESFVHDDGTGDSKGGIISRLK